MTTRKFVMCYLAYREAEWRVNDLREAMDSRSFHTQQHSAINAFNALVSALPVGVCERETGESSESLIERLESQLAHIARVFYNERWRISVKDVHSELCKMLIKGYLAGRNEARCFIDLVYMALKYGEKLFVVDDNALEYLVDMGFLTESQAHLFQNQQTDNLDSLYTVCQEVLNNVATRIGDGSRKSAITVNVRDS